MKVGFWALVVLSCLLVHPIPPRAQDSNWEPVTGADRLRQFMSGLVTERRLPGGVISRAEYEADGTGILYSCGGKFERTWEIQGKDQFCIETGQRDSRCYYVDRNSVEHSTNSISGSAAEDSIVAGFLFGVSTIWT